MSTVIRRAQVDLHVGNYQQACAQTEAALPLLRDALGAGGFEEAIGQRVLGWAALAEETYAEAAQWLAESVATFRTAQEFHAEEFLAWSLAGLTRAVHGTGNRSAAQGHLLEALEITLDMSAFIPLLHLMPVIAVVLADAGHVERAVEVYALAEGRPFVANSQLFEDIAGRFVEAAATSLPPDVVEAAGSRGQALNG